MGETSSTDSSTASPSPSPSADAGSTPSAPPPAEAVLARGIARAQQAALLSHKTLPQAEQTGDPEVDAVLTAVVSAEQHDQAQGAQQLARLAAQDLLAFAGPAPAGSAP